MADAVSSALILYFKCIHTSFTVICRLLRRRTSKLSPPGWSELWEQMTHIRLMICKFSGFKVNACTMIYHEAGERLTRDSFIYEVQKNSDGVLVSSAVAAKWETLHWLGTNTGMLVSMATACFLPSPAPDVWSRRMQLLPLSAIFDWSHTILEVVISLSQISRGLASSYGSSSLS